MNIAEYSVRHRTVSWMVLILLAVGGALAFLDLGRLEDPPFVRKDAMIVTAYPGATAEEVHATGLAEVNFFPDQLELYHRIATYGGPVWIQGKVTEHLSSFTLECSNCGQAA